MKPQCSICEADWLASCADHQPVTWRMAPIRPASTWQPQTPDVRLAQALERSGGNPYERKP